jgi:2-phosphoglycerate kinase
MKRKIILIGGMPTAGKTTIARKVASHFNLPYISGDQIRLIMQSVANIDKFPLLFNSEKLTAEEFLTKYTAEEIAEMEYEQGNEVWLGIAHFIEHDWVWRSGCVIEGVSILPLLVKKHTSKHDVEAVFLSDSNHIRIQHVVYNRGLFDDASTYSDDVKDKEIEWVKLFDQKLRVDALSASYPIIEINKDDSDIENVLAVLSA